MLPVLRRGLSFGLPTALALAALTACGGSSEDPTAPPTLEPSCAIVDTDFDIDDMMAIPLVIGNQHVAALVVSEGYAKADLGAAALSRLVTTVGQRAIPVVVGEATNLSDSTIVSEWGDFVLQYRDLMHRLNDSLPAPLPPPPDAGDYVARVGESVASCQSVDVLVIGTFSSFVNYAPALREKLGKVVVMGKPFEGDTTQPAMKHSFNCKYDIAACEKVRKEQLPGLDYAYVDVRRSDCDATPNADGCLGKVYGPNGTMVKGLVAEGLPGTLRTVLLGNPDSWNIDNWPNATYGGRSLLWDQSAALYLVNPDLFEMVEGNGGHFETTSSPDAYRQAWTDATNAAATFKLTSTSGRCAGSIGRTGGLGRRVDSRS
ncbi:MAG: nucleoside hydrolase, partial [Deltaproteobacteria bacterium]|nr:nucleoside hydrolase [Deltaproteobacteria bacterium]